VCLTRTNSASYPVRKMSNSLPNWLMCVKSSRSSLERQRHGFINNKSTYFDSVFELSEFSTPLVEHIAVSSSET